MQESLNRQTHRPSAMILAVAITEGDELPIVTEDALGAEGRAINISGQVLESRFTATDELHVSYPVHRPDLLGDLAEKLGVVLSEGFFEPGAQAHGQGPFGQEIVGPFGSDPTQAIGRQTAGGHDTMHVRMKTQVTRPGLEHGQQPQFGAEVFVIAPHLQ